MRIFITGATGVIGRRLVIDRLERIDEVVLLSRDVERASKLFAAQANRKITVVQGNPAAPGSWQEKVAGCDAVIHLAAAGIADRRWSKSYKKLIVSSRVDSTYQVVSAIEQASPDLRPKVFINGSATGFYGDGGDRELDENALAGNGFLARLSVPWEQHALRAESLGVRVVLLRSGVVLDDRGGGLKKMMLPFRFFVGGPLGSGRQYLPWIHWRDLMGLIDLALEDPQLKGPMNAVAPEMVRQREFAAELGAVMNRPSFMPAPKFALRLVLGEMATVLTTSQRAVPTKAQQFGYSYLYPKLEPALNDLLVPRPSADLDLESSAETAPRFPITKSPAPNRQIAKSPDASPQVPIKLLAIAVDGALLRSDGSLAQGIVQSCRAAERAGCVIVLASARPPRGTKPIVQALDIAGPTINYNGAAIWNPLDDKPQFHEPLAAELVRQIIADAKAVQPDLAIGLEVLDRWYVDRVDPRFDMGAAEPDYVGSLEQFLAEPITKLTLIGVPEQINLVLEMIREKYWRPRSVAVFLTDSRLIQITHPMVDKGIALQRIAKRMGLNREQVMAIGDSSNDLGMIEWAGFGVAVENASQAVLDLADAIVPSHDEMGVARAIQRYVLAKR